MRLSRIRFAMPVDWRRPAMPAWRNAPVLTDLGAHLARVGLPPGPTGRAVDSTGASTPDLSTAIERWNTVMAEATARELGCWDVGVFPDLGSDRIRVFTDVRCRPTADDDC